MKTSRSQQVAAGHFVRSSGSKRPIAAIVVDGQSVDLAAAEAALAAAEAKAAKYRAEDASPSLLSRAKQAVGTHVGKPLKSAAMATLATLGATLGRVRGRPGDAAVDGALRGAAIGRAKSNPSRIRAWLNDVADRANFSRLVGLEVLASYHPDKVADRHDVEVRFADGEVVRSAVEVVDHQASFYMNRYVATVSAASLVPPGFPTGLGTFGATAVLMGLASYLVGLTGRRALAASMRRVAAESAVLAPVALTSLAADAAYVGASAVHLAMHRTVKESEVVRELSPQDVERGEASLSERVDDAKKRARRLMDLTAKVKALAAKDPTLLELLHDIATKEAQEKIAAAVALHERSERAEGFGLHGAAVRLEHDAEGAAEQAVDAQRIALVSEDAIAAQRGAPARRGTLIGRVVDAEQHQVVADSDHQPIDESDVGKALGRITSVTPVEPERPSPPKK